MKRAGPVLLTALALPVVLAAARPASADGPVATRLVKGPYVSGFSDSHVDVRFELDAPGPATLEIGREHAQGPLRKIVDGATTAAHLIHVTGLEAGKAYSYGVQLGGTLAARGSVTTAPPPDSTAPVQFAVYGDDRSDTSAHAAVVRAIGRMPVTFLVNTGDMVEDGASAAGWRSFFDIEAPLLRQKPLLVSIGNHELYNDEAGAAFARYFGFPDAGGILRPYGTTRVGNVRLFFLNSMHDWRSGEERDWLTQALTAADAEPGLAWRIAVTHQAPWSSGPHGANQKLVSAHIPELLTAHKVDLLFAGHDHIYERGAGGPLKYVISGGGGAPLYQITGSSPASRKTESTYHVVQVTAGQTDVRLVAYRLDGSEIERCGFGKDGPWDCDRAPPPAAPGQPAQVTPTPAPKSSRCSASTPGSLHGAGSSAGVALALLGVLAGRRVGVRRRRRG